MVNRSGHSRNPKVSQSSATSRLLNLPAELRNLVYEYVAQTAESVAFREGKLLYCPALSLVCHQIRDEYEQIYLGEASKYATRVNVHVTNFLTSTKAGAVSSIHDLLPEPLSGVERLFTVRVLLTNFWDRHRQELRNFVEHGDFLRAKFDLELAWDPKTFDAEFLRENVPKMRFCFGRMFHRTDVIWVQFEKALETAFSRYAPSVPPTKRKRKRRNVEVAAAASRKKQNQC